MTEEKVSFVYPTLLRDGMHAGSFYPPQISIVPEDRDRPQTLAVTAGFILRQTIIYYMEIGIYRSDESVITNPDKAGLIQTKFYERTANSELLTIYSMIASGVDLSQAGLYRIYVKAYGTQDGVKDEVPAAQNECSFFVSHRD